ncbi:MAG: response regulator [Bacteroidales bacterium]|nr:response regulator [Bacteroidales bacterium]
MKDKLKIVLCEDNLSDAELVRYTLKKFKFDFELTHVTNRQQYVDYLSDYNPDLILSDFSMGQFNGIDALDIAKKMCPLVPFIIVTGTLDEYTAVDTIKAGAWDYVIKENLLRLKSAIGNALKLREERDLKSEALQKLSVSEHEFRTLYENVPVGVFRLNQNDEISSANSVFLELFGFTSENQLRKFKFSKLFVEKFQHEEIRRKLEAEALVKNYGAKLAYGEHQFDALIGMKANFVEGVSLYYDCIVQNISELKVIQNELKIAKEKAEESNKLKEVFLANLSHEIRTPLNAIFGFSDLIDDEDISLDQKLVYLKTIKSSSKQLFTVFNDIMDLSLIESGQIFLDKNDFILNEVMAEMYSQYQQIIRNKEKRALIIEFKPGLEFGKSIIYQDSIRLRQVINNLLSNAVKFTHQGKIRFGYRFIQEDNALQFFVEDTGVGIPKEKRDLIFESFRQVEETYTRNYGGTGLGLSIAKALVEKMGGTISFESTVGKGSSFYFTIPFNSEIVNDKIATSVEPKSVLFVEKTILVVEDEEINFLYLEEVLTEINVTVLHAVNHSECFAILKDEKVDLILMDLRLPGVNGFEITELIRKTDKNIPIIAQTAYSAPEDKRKALQVGCNDYISKPFTRRELVAVVEKFI